MFAFFTAFVLEITFDYFDSNLCPPPDTLKELGATFFGCNFMFILLSWLPELCERLNELLLNF